MKSLIVAGMIAFTGLASAQNGTGAAPSTQATPNGTQKKQMSPEDRAIRVLRMITAKAGLTDVQQAEVKQILIEREKAKMAAKEANKDAKEAAVTARKQAHQDAEAKLKAAMTPEQWAKWEAFRAENKAKRQEGKNGTGSNAPANPANEEDFY